MRLRGAGAVSGNRRKALIEKARDLRTRFVQKVAYICFRDVLVRFIALGHPRKEFAQRHAVGGHCFSERSEFRLRLAAFHDRGGLHAVKHNDVVSGCQQRRGSGVGAL